MLPSNEYITLWDMALKDLSNNIIIQKQKVQDQRIEFLEKEMDDMNFKMNTFIANRYNSSKIYENYYFVERNSMDNSEQNILFKSIITEVQKLKDLDDIRDQIASCAYICKKTLSLLKKYHSSNEESYNKKVLHLFYQAIKRNYSKCLLTSEQVAIMLDMLEESKNSFVGEHKYWEFDERLYDAGLAVFPEEG